MQTALRHQPSVAWGLMLYVGYLTVFFAAWAINGVDYLRIGESAETTKLWYAIPTLLGCSFLVVALTWLGWWRLALFDASKSGPRWLWVLPAVILAIIVHNFARLNVEKLAADLLLWSLLGAIGVGFGEEMITRGSMVVGLRSRFSETGVWLFSTLLFSAMHAPNMLFGMPPEGVPVQLVLTFVFGSGLYVIRRISGTLLLPMALHGLWDSSIFLSTATGVHPSVVQLAAYPLTIVCLIAFLRSHRPAPNRP